MSEKEKATREYLETLSKEQVIDLCLQYINDKNIAEQQLEALMLEISKQEVEQHDLPDYCTRTGTDCTNLGKIEELKQQLEESFTEEDVESLIEDRDKTIKFMQKELAEKDCRIEELEGQFAYECECNKQLVDLQKQLAEKDTRIAELEDKDWYEACIKQLEEQNDRLIGKLKEKDKEIESLTNRTNRYENMFRSRISRTGDMQKDIELYMKQLAIQELEKVKNKCNGMYELWLYSNHKENMYNNEDIAGVFEDISVFTNDLIKKLKGE